MEKEQFLSSIYLIIRNEKKEILLQKRIGTKLWCGFYALPAGHVDKGENPYDALIREAKEELDIDLKASDILSTFVICRRNNFNDMQPYYDVYFEIGKYSGTIKINEPGKCAELLWADEDKLPDKMISYEKEALKMKRLEMNNKPFNFGVIDVDSES